MLLLLLTFAEAAKKIASPSPGWGTSMEGQLGEIKEIRDFSGGRCQLTDGLWWMLGLLTASGLRQADAAASGVSVGSRVRVRDGVTPRYGWGGVQGERGEVIEMEDDGHVRVRFSSHPRWRGELSELVLEGEDSPQPQASAASDIRVGDEALSDEDVESEDETETELEEDTQWERETSKAEEPQYGGHEEDWADVEAAAEFKCPICLKVCCDAVIHSCRGIFCESCWNFCHAADDECPICHETEKPAQQAYQQWDIGKLLVAWRSLHLQWTNTWSLHQRSTWQHGSEKFVH